MVDKFVEAEKFPVDATEQAVLLHSVNEDKSRKHLKVTNRTVVTAQVADFRITNTLVVVLFPVMLRYYTYQGSEASIGVILWRKRTILDEVLYLAFFK